MLIECCKALKMNVFCRFIATLKFNVICSVAPIFLNDFGLLQVIRHLLHPSIIWPVLIVFVCAVVHFLKRGRLLVSLKCKHNFCHLTLEMDAALSE